MIAGIVLAAGRSSRMGSPKALLMLADETFLSRAVTALREGGCDSVIVVIGRPDDEPNPRIMAEALRVGAKIAVNPDPESEQIDSLRAAIKSLPEGTRGMIVTPVDSPRVRADVVAALIAAGAGGARIAVPTSDRQRGHPIFFSKSLIPEIERDDLSEGARSLIRRHDRELVEVPVATPDILLDIDTPEDYRRLTGGTE